jgi:hypothetical protein
MIPLKRLTLVDCDFPLKVSAMVEAFRASGTKEFKYNGGTPQGMVVQWRNLEALRDEALRELEALGELEELGVSVTYDGESEWLDSFEREWWTYGHDIDVMDSEIY